MRPLLLSDLAREATTPLPELLALPGRVQTSVIQRWATHLNRRHGPGAARSVLQRLALDSTALPDAPNPGQWMAGGLQCALTDAIAMQFYDGDLQRLEAPLLEDAQRGVGRMSRLIVRGLGPARLLSKASDLHAQTWDLGEVSVTLKEHSAVINVSGSPLFTYRTWLALQLMALKGTVSLTGLSVETLYASRIASDRAQLTVAWC